MTGDGALICSVDCLTHTSPHVGASLGLPTTPIPPPMRQTPNPPSPSLPPATPKCSVVPGLHSEEEVGTGLWSTAATTSIASEG